MDHKHFRLGAGTLLLALLAACSTTQQGTPRISGAWVLQDQAGAMARVNTPDAQCPSLQVDGKTLPMQLRAPAAIVPQRTTISNPIDSKPSLFAEATCEARIPAGASHAEVAGTPLPLPHGTVQRIVVLGDSGCRIKKTDNIYQACSSESEWPFPTVAATAANFKPDLVIHVGDYHYRETACPAGMEGCRNSPWGYGSDAWEADFLRPAAPLLAAAPWVFVRGNHEECARAGQGWFRYLDPAPYTAERSCDDPANDNLANYSAPYAVDLGAGSQLIVFDSAKSGQKALQPDDPQYRIYHEQFEAVDRLAAQDKNSIFISHHPVFGFVQYKGDQPRGFGAAFQSVMASLHPQRYFPDGVHLALHGHVHNFQAINFSTSQPATIVSGNGGDVVDPNFPDPFPASSLAAPGTVMESIAHTNTFGFIVMERATAGWQVKVYTRKGELMDECATAQGRIHCSKTGYIGPVTQ